METRIVMYGAPETLFSDNGSQFASELLRNGRVVVDIEKAFTIINYPHTNRYTELHDRMVLEMVRCYVNDRQRDWVEYIQVLTYAYNTGIHSSTMVTPFQLVLSRTPSNTAIYDDI